MNQLGTTCKLCKNGISTDSLCRMVQRGQAQIGVRQPGRTPMSERDRTTPDAPDSAVTLRHMIMGFRVTQLIYVAAKIGVADLLRLGPQSIDALAAGSG